MLLVYMIRFSAYVLTAHQGDPSLHKLKLAMDLAFKITASTATTTTTTNNSKPNSKKA